MVEVRNKSGLKIESIEEVNQMFREVSEYTVRGLSELDSKYKQFYLERILLTLGLSVAECRERLPWIEHGVNPEEEELSNGITPDD